MYKKTRGFTIVELLIVIVVIGILASIVIVAYRGVREGAIDAKRSAAIDQYVKILSIYRIQNGSLPEETGCIGEAKDYPATGGFDAGFCLYDGPGRGISVSDDLNDKLKTVSSNLPDPSGSTYVIKDPESDDVAFMARGMWYTAGTLVYYDSIKNGLSCPKGEVQSHEEANIVVCQVTIDD